MISEHLSSLSVEDTPCKLYYANMDDLDIAVAVDQACFMKSDWWNIDLWRGMLKNRAGCRVLLAKIPNIITGNDELVETTIGFAAFDKSGKVMKLAVNPSMQRRGIGGQLLREVLSVLETEFRKYSLGASLNVDSCNTAAVALYQRYGFKTDCIVGSYYGPGRDAWRMLRDHEI